MISYTVTACDEDKELNKLLNFLRVNIKDGDEVIIQLDSTNVTDEVRKVTTSYAEKIPLFKIIEFPLNKDFATFKNNLNSYCSKEWIFNIDADELPASFLIENIHSILKENSSLDLFVVPRWNMVNDITESHIEKWNWRFDEYGRINWPDWQMRLYKNKNEIRWKNKVHEVLEGFTSYTFLPEDKDYCLYHNKTFQRQEKHNNFYEEIK